MSHFSASPGTNLPGSGSQTNGSQMFSVTRMLVSKLVTCGSSVSSKSPLKPYTNVPPPAAAGAVVGFAAGAVVGAAAAGAVVAVAAGAVVAAAAGAVVGLAAAGGAAVGAAGAPCWQAARPIALTAVAAMSRNSRRRITDISPPSPSTVPSRPGRGSG